MKRYVVIRFDRDEQPIATADFATRQEADETYAEWIGFRGQSGGGVQLISPSGFLVKRLEFKKP